MEKYRFSIVTVCYNAVNHIEETVNSVFSQTFLDYEYIIIDGKSTDGTDDIVSKMLEEKTGITFVSERDKGIYDAMNKGIDLATGEYILFLNAGDCLLDESVLQKVNTFIDNNVGDVFYGNVIRIVGGSQREYRVYSSVCAKKWYYLSGDCICHQAIFARTEILRTRKFDLSYQICADKEWMMYNIQIGYKLIPMNFAVSVVLADGFSLQHVELFEEETRRCLNRYLPKSKWIFECVYFLKHQKLIRICIRKIGEVFFIRNKYEK